MQIEVDRQSTTRPFMREAGPLIADGVGAPQDGASTGRVAGVVLLSLVTPGLGHIRLGRWQVGLILVGLAQCVAVGLRAVPNLMAPTPKALLILVATGGGLLLLVIVTAFHAAWLARREVIEVKTISRSGSTYVPLPLDVRVREAGPSMEGEDRSKRPMTPWFTAGCLIAAGIAGVILLPAKWAIVTMPQIAMAPNIAVGDRVLVDLHRVGLSPRRGEIVLLRSRDDDAPFLVRRVIGLPGDRLVMRRMTLLLNGNRYAPVATSRMVTVDGIERPVFIEALPFVEPYGILPDVASQMADEPRFVLVPSGRLMGMRDDRASPISWAGSVSGLAPIDEIEGIATTILWPRGGGLPRRL